MDWTITGGWRSVFGLTEMVETTHYLAKVFITSWIIIILTTPVILKKTFTITGKSPSATAKSSALSRRGSANAWERL